MGKKPMRGSYKMPPPPVFGPGIGGGGGKGSAQEETRKGRTWPPKAVKCRGPGRPYVSRPPRVKSSPQPHLPSA